MKNCEDKIYSLGETVTGQTQAMSQAVQKTLRQPQPKLLFFVKHFSLKKASEFPVFSEGFFLL